MHEPLTPYCRLGTAVMEAVRAGHTVTCRPEAGRLVLIIDGCRREVGDLPGGVKLVNLAICQLVKDVPAAEPVT